MDMLPVRILAPASKPDIPISSVAVLECYLETGLSWNLHFGSQALASIHPVASAANSSTFYLVLLSCPSICCGSQERIDISDLCQSRSRYGRSRKEGRRLPATRCRTPPPTSRLST